MPPAIFTVPVSHRYAKSLFTRTAQNIGCDDGASDVMDCLRHADVNLLKQVNMNISRSAFSGEFQYVPVVDGKFIQQSPVAAISSRDLNGVCLSPIYLFMGIV